MADKKEKKLSALDRAVQQAMGDGRELGDPTDPAATAFPQLWAWLSTVYVGRDRLKNPATLSIRLSTGCAVVSLVDRDLSVSVEVTAASLAELLPALEAALSGSNPPLKSWGRKEPHLRKRRNAD